MRTLAAAAVLAALAAVAACSKPQQPKVDAAAERQEAHDRASKDAFSAQVQAVDKAQALQQDLNRKAEERGAAADAMSK